MTRKRMTERQAILALQAMVGPSTDDYDGIVADATTPELARLARLEIAVERQAVRLEALIAEVDALKGR